MDRVAATAIALLVALVLAPPGAWPQQLPGQPIQTIAIRLSNFAFEPDQLRLHLGTPVHLHLVNESGGNHDFSAPALFAASAFPTAPPPRNGKIDVPAKSSVDVTLIPRAAGTYRFECTHFLHSLFGMTGSITVTGP